MFDPVVDSTTGTPITLTQVPGYDGTNAGYLANLRSVLSTPAWQMYLLQPNYWQVWWPGYGWVDWRVNLPENDVTQEAAAALAATGGTSATPPPLPSLAGSPLRRAVGRPYPEEREEDAQQRLPRG